ncbi:cellulase family glycosylhydrolase [Priestia aryabhattai]|uniref:cellulase family glycosylhydrolase n=1 Tax=Priestia aryabhattai TaxID=412384 RepID=UPI000BF1F19D|nr:cellulase family glycosylhydrolase [Priestia aryabhattai]PEI51827.1 glycoside hydrolase family 5 [Priestia aryabhattai]
MQLKIKNHPRIKWIMIIILIIVLISGSLIIRKIEYLNSNQLKSYNTIPQGLGVNIDMNVTKEDIQAISNAGFKWVRVDIFWERVETNKGIYNFKDTGYDRLNKWIKEEGLKPYYILDYSNKLYEEDRSIETKKGRKAFVQFAKAVTQRYKSQEAIWEIWNEPNFETFWEQKSNYNDYAKLVKVVAPIIKMQDKSGIVVAPALSRVDKTSLAWLDKIFKQGILEDIDAVSVHPYRYSNPETVSKSYKMLTDLIENYTDDKIPVISGEWGYSMRHTPKESLSEKQQAEYLIRTFLINAKNHIPISIWYNWKNKGWSPNEAEQNFGIMWYDLNPKLSYHSIKTISSVLKGYSFEKQLEYGKPKDYILRFQNEKGKKVLVFWTIDNRHDITLSLSSGTGTLVSMEGERRKVQWNQNEIVLSLSSSPSYLLIN